MIDYVSDSYAKAISQWGDIFIGFDSGGSDYYCEVEVAVMNGHYYILDVRYEEQNDE